MRRAMCLAKMCYEMRNVPRKDAMCNPLYVQLRLAKMSRAAQQVMIYVQPQRCVMWLKKMFALRDTRRPPFFLSCLSGRYV